MKLLALTFCGLLLATSISTGTTIIYPNSEGEAVRMIARGYTLYSAVSKREPKSWNEINSVFVKPLNKINSRIEPETRYAFLTTPLYVPNSNERIVIISKSPFHSESKIRGLWGSYSELSPTTLRRFLVVVAQDGQAYDLLMRETEVQQLFANAKISLPDPDPLGSRPYEIENYFKVSFWLLMFLSVIGYILLRLRWPYTALTRRCS